MEISRVYVRIAVDEVVEKYFSTNYSLEKILREVMKKYECKGLMQDVDA